MNGRNSFLVVFILVLFALQASGQVICTLEYDPHCCLTDGVLATAGNLCQCTGNSGEPIYTGECETSSSPSPSPTIDANSTTVSNNTSFTNTTNQPELEEKLINGSKSDSGRNLTQSNNNVSIILPTTILKNEDSESSLKPTTEVNPRNSAIPISENESTETWDEIIMSTQTPIPSSSPQLESEMGDNIVCTTEENPVCCKFADGSEETKTNPCFCSASFGTVSLETACVKPPLPSLLATNNPMPCSDDEPTVCCRNANTGDVKTVANVCVCEFDQSIVLYYGECTF